MVVACVLVAYTGTLAQSTPPSGVPSAEQVNGALIARYLPRVEYRGGAFVRRPRLVTITFAGDDPEVVARLERFADTITRTRWWRAVVAGYCASDGDCIGESRSSVPVRLNDTLPAEVHAVDISALLRRYASAGRLGPPTRSRCSSSISRAASACGTRSSRGPVATVRARFIGRFESVTGPSATRCCRDAPARPRSPAARATSCWRW